MVAMYTTTMSLASRLDACIMRWPRPGTPNISDATTAIQAWPSAVREPGKHVVDDA
ncbi:hypothetical protein ABH994_001403 [Bradyrhizobium yuanmingense]